jgi:cytochrome c biogenesis protein
MPKEYRSELTILKDGKELLKKAIVVNDPLQYNGITFYQSSYQGFRDFITRIAEENGDAEQFVSEFQKQVHWSEKDLSFGVINLENIGDRVSRVKIWFSDGKGSPSEFWMNAGESVKINRTGTTYLFSTKQRYATGLQVAKDPGVWIVYFGFGLMLSGLFMAFFMSHKRIWLLVDTIGPETVIVLSASANKNKAGFAKLIGDLAEKLKHSIQ